MDQLKKQYPTIHLELRRGTAAQAAEYCRKNESRLQGGLIYEQGEISKPAQGTRTDLADACIILKEQGLHAVAEQCSETFVRYHNGFRALANIIAVNRPAGPRIVYVLFGPPGTGKTRFANHLAETLATDSKYYPVQNNSGLASFETYSNEKTIIMDDFDETQISRGALKTMTDRYCICLPGRGQSPMNNADQVIITSNSDPRTWYTKDETFWPALRRRATKIIFCGNNEWSTIVENGDDVIPDAFNIGLKFVKPVYTD